MVARLGQRQVHVLGELGDHLTGQSGGGVDAGSHGRPAQRQFADAGQHAVQPLDAVAHLRRVARELLTQGHRGGVHQVGASGLDDRRELGGLGLEGLGEVLERGYEVDRDRPGGGDVDRGRELVVGRERVVDVVIGVDGRAEPFGRQARQHLVGVHVRRGARSRLEHVDRELGVPVAARDLDGAVVDRLGLGGVEHALAAAQRRRRALDRGERADQFAFDRPPRDREVLDRALGLGTPLGGRGHADLAHRVLLDAVFGVSHAPEPIGSGPAGIRTWITAGANCCWG